ncbi:MAG: hypothetical protein ACSHYA_20365 [Opitutaceae bacterium]
MKKLFVFLILVAIALSAIKPEFKERAFEIIEGILPEPSPLGATKIVVSYDGSCEIAVDAGWEKLRGLYSFDKTLYHIQVGMKSGRTGIVVLAERVGDPKYHDLEAYGEYTSQFTLSRMKGGRISNGPFDVTIGGMQGRQYVLMGRMEGRDVVVLHTNLQGNYGFYQVMAITTEARLEKEKESLLKAVRSFRESTTGPRKIPEMIYH